MEENNTNYPQKPMSEITKSCFEWLEAIVVSLVAAIFVLTFLFRTVNVSGVSMMDTLLDKDRIVITNTLYTPKTGDVVVISHGEIYQEPIVKRVIATEGQTLDINFQTGAVTVDGKVLDEPYIKNLTTRQGDGVIPSVIPKGYIFVMGDNRNRSLDSRSREVGLIDKNNVLGKVQCIIYPFSRIGGVR